MGRSHAKKRQRFYTVGVVLIALVGVACLVYAGVCILGPEAASPTDLTDKSQPYSSASESDSLRGESAPETTRPPETTQPIDVQVPVILQDGLPTGCEATAAAMLLQAYGYDISKEDVASALPLTQAETVNGRQYAAHPEVAFLGNPFTSSGFGIFSPAIAQTMQQLIDKQGGHHTVVDLKGASEEEILAYIDRGIPVCIWSTMDGRDIVNNYSWYIKDGDTYTDQLFVWPGNEHCLVLTDYNEDQVMVNDPQQGAVQYGREDFFRHYREVGRYALVIT